MSAERKLANAPAAAWPTRAELPSAVPYRGMRQEMATMGYQRENNHKFNILPKEVPFL
jgi:hypothetical protein